MRCPYCLSLDDKVVDSRASEDGVAIRRRRECIECSRRFTTYERLEELPLTVTKRSGARVPFDRQRIVSGVSAAAKNRPVSEDQLGSLAGEVEEELRIIGSDVPSEAVGLAVLRHLRAIDEVTYLRFASVYKDFAGVEDFEREVVMLTKESAPKT